MSDKSNEKEYKRLIEERDAKVKLYENQKDRMTTLSEDEIIEEWIEEKARVLSNLIQLNILAYKRDKKFHLSKEKELKNFIRKLFEEMPAKKAKVSVEFVEKHFGGIEDCIVVNDRDGAIDGLIQMLTEAGHGVRKPITEEWIEEKAEEMLVTFSPKACKDFIRSLVEELNND